MDKDTIDRLRRLNNAFYREQAESFSATRQEGWDGWQRCLEFLPQQQQRKQLSVFDLACGNLRFAEFLAKGLPGVAIDYYGVDNCDELVPEDGASEAVKTLRVNYQSLDVLELLQQDKGDGSDQLEAPPCDLSVAFGFMHHIPTQAYRSRVLQVLLQQTRPGGHIIVSFWQFMKNASLAAKARISDGRAHKELGFPPLEEGDYLLDWQNKPGAYRYCHSFSDAEIDQLAEATSPAAEVIARFNADGRSGDLNRYLILRVI